MRCGRTKNDFSDLTINAIIILGNIFYKLNLTYLVNNRSIKQTIVTQKIMSNLYQPNVDKNISNTFFFKSQQKITQTSVKKLNSLKYIFIIDVKKF